MLAEWDDLSRSFPWVKELWLLNPPTAGRDEPGDGDLVVVSELPPRQVPPGQRQRLLTQVQTLKPGRLDLRLTTSEQLSTWLAMNGRFATTFRRHAVKLFERPSGQP